MMQPLGMATFARFYDATDPQRVTVVRDSKIASVDRDSYMRRDYYSMIQNTLRRTHWDTNDISAFEDAIDPLLYQIASSNTKGGPAKRDNYEKLARAYVDYWVRQDASYFPIEQAELEIAGLPVLITPECGVYQHGDNFAVKLWFGAKPPKGKYKQAIQFLMLEAQRQLGWRTDLAPVILDIRRETFIYPQRPPRDFTKAIESQAAAFLYLWDSI